MSIENFFTTQTQTPSLLGQKPAASGSSSAPSQLEGLSFLDYILTRVAEKVAKADGHDEQGDEALQSDNPIFGSELNLAELLAANPEVEEELKDFIAATQLGPESELTQVLALNQQAFDDALKPLTGGIITSEEIANGSPRILQAFLIEPSEGDEGFALDMNSLKAKIQAAIEGDKSALTITNLTPEQITALQNLPEGAELPEELIGNPFIAIIQLQPSKDDNAGTGDLSTDGTVIDSASTDIVSDDPTLQNLIAVLVAPINQASSKAQAQVETTQQTLPQSSAQPLAQGTPQPQTEALAGRLNNLNVGSGEPLFTIEDYDGSLQPEQNGKGQNGKNFEALLKNTNQNASGPSPDLSFLQGPAFGSEGSLLAPLGFSQEMLDQYGLNTASTSVSTLGTLTSSVTQSQSASAPHPATQMVAINMQKAAGNGENRTLVLQLDPPELGRVHVKMEFGADKTLKAVVTTEKPETFMMMQRDIQSLERAMQEIGLDTDAGLSFELAEHGFDFDQDNQRGGGHDGGGTGGGSESNEAEEIIQSTMTWHIDSETGHTRYDILA